jgi:hypothetical protein
MPLERSRIRFEILGDLTGVETIAVGRGIRSLAKLRRRYGRTNWRKCKAFAEIRLHSGEIGWAELHWHEAARIGQCGMKIKQCR